MTRKTHHFHARSRQSAIFEASVLVTVQQLLNIILKRLFRLLPTKFIVSFTFSIIDFDNIDLTVIIITVELLILLF